MPFFLFVKIDDTGHRIFSLGDGWEFRTVAPFFLPDERDVGLKTAAVVEVDELLPVRACETRDAVIPALDTEIFSEKVSFCKSVTADPGQALNLIDDCPV